MENQISDQTVSLFRVHYTLNGMPQPAKVVSADSPTNASTIIRGQFKESQLQCIITKVKKDRTNG
jgi:hypothetical protein